MIVSPGCPFKFLFNFGLLNLFERSATCNVPSPTGLLFIPQHLVIMEVDKTSIVPPSEGLRQYYITKIEDLMLTVSEKNQNLRRLQAQRNELNAKVRMLREELQLLQEQGKGDALYSIVRLSSSNASSLNILGGLNGYRLRDHEPHEAAGRATNHSLLLHNLGHFHDGDQTKVKAGCCQRRFLFHEPKAGARLNALYWV